MSLLNVAAKRVLPAFILLAIASAVAQQRDVTPRITQPIDESQLTRLAGNVHPLARPEFDQGRAPSSMLADRMLLVLSRSKEQERSLRQFLEEQQTPGSTNYHKWLTPEEFGQMFGPSDQDVQTVTTWLLNHGFQVDGVSSGKTAIEFSGTAGQLRQTFHTDLHKYVVEGKTHWANANDPEIPSALAPVVKGFVSLNNFPRKKFTRTKGAFSRDTQTGGVKPLLTVPNGSQNYYLLGPGDFANIYNSQPLIQAGTNGSGQTIAIVGATNINVQDVTDFRNLFGLSNVPDNHTKVIVNGPDPGIVADEPEAILDVEWSGAAAPGANIVLVASQSTETTSGIDLSALYIVENNLAPVMSESYGTCERSLGNAGNQFINSLWQQAAAQGITVIVSSGDSGSAGCDYAAANGYATNGTAVNGLASTPYNVAVGGTDFNDAGTQTTYWSTTNAQGTWTSANSYVPERTWNDSCAGGLSPTTSSCTSSSNVQLWAASGGPSNCSQLDINGSCLSGTSKPSWQTGTGVPSDGARDIPDLSLFAATGTSGSNSFYVVCQADALPPGYPSCLMSGGSVYFVGAAGTSASAPAFAGIVAIANQKVGTRLGNVNYLLYQSAAQTGASCSTSSTSTNCVFRDVIAGGISVPCQGGTPNCSASSSSAKGVLVDNSGNLAYMAGTGYDLATGLGSVNVTNLVNAMAAAQGKYTATSTALTLNGGTAQITAAHGSSISVGVSVTPTATSGSVSLIGNSRGFDNASLSGGLANWSSTMFPGGDYSVQAHYAGDGSHNASDSNSVAVSITPEASNTFVNMVTFDNTGNPQSYTANTTPYGSFYIVRADVTDAAGTVSPSQGVNSTCATVKASCPTGNVVLTANGTKLDAGTYALNTRGYTEDQTIQLIPGNYNLSAAYSGDSSYKASTGTSAITITKAPTSLTAGTPALAPYQYGTSVQIQGQLSTTSTGTAPSGTLTWLDNGVDASGSIQYPSTQPTSGSSNGFASLGYTAGYVPPSLGDHTLTAQYAGDANYLGSNLVSYTITVTKASVLSNSYVIRPSVATPTLPVTLGVSFLSRSQIGTPTGTITFSDNGTPINGTVTYTSSGSMISGTLTMTFSQTGQHTLSASYSGDTYNLSATQALGTLNVSSQLATTLQASSNLSPTVVNYPTTLTATVVIPQSNGLPTPTGTITFSDNNQQLSGNVTYAQSFTGYGSFTLVASLPYSFTSAGTHDITATYSGDSIYAAATAAAYSQSVVDKLSTQIPSLSVYDIAVNHPTTLTVDVYSSVINSGPMMTGTVTFLDGGTPMQGTVSITSEPGYIIANLPYTFTTPGTHNITVQYSGDKFYAATTSQSFAQDILSALALRLVGNPSLTLGANGGSGSTTMNVYNTTSTPVTVALSCTPDSSRASCSVNNSVSLGANGVNMVSITFTVPALSAAVHDNRPFRMPLVFAGLLGGIGLTFGRKRKAVMMLLLMGMLMLAAVSCGGGGGTTGGGGGGGGTQPKVYKFTVTGTAGANTDSQVFTVTVQ